MLFNTNMQVSLEEYNISEDAENLFDVIVKVKLKQYKNYGLKTVKISNEKNKALSYQKERSTESAPNNKTYIVKKGDCLWNIAKKEMGNGDSFKKIYSANQKLIDKRNENTGYPVYTIYPGQKLIIPR